METERENPLMTDTGRSTGPAAVALAPRPRKHSAPPSQELPQRSAPGAHQLAEHGGSDSDILPYNSRAGGAGIGRKARAASGAFAPAPTLARACGAPCSGCVRRARARTG